MKLIVGLGNPGKSYQQTRHNIGSSVVRAWAQQHDCPLKRTFLSSSLTARLRIGHEQAIAAVPLTYMNLSGPAVAALVKKHDIASDRLLIVLDDLDLEPGRLRVKASGSAGGHKGLASVITALGTQEFARLRIGVGRPADSRMDTADYVLSVFTRKEKQVMEQTIEKAVEAIDLWLTQPLEKTMNNVNRQGEQHA